MEYYCGNCLQLEPFIKMWKKDLDWERRRRWEHQLNSSSSGSVSEVSVIEHKY